MVSRAWPLSDLGDCYYIASSANGRPNGSGPFNLRPTRSEAAREGCSVRTTIDIMANKEQVIIDEILRISKKIGKNKFTRGEFLENTNLVKRENIEKYFGSFANAMKTAGLRPQRHHKVTNEELFRAYDKTYKVVGHYPLGHPGEEELYKISSISGFTFRERFGGMKNFLFEYKNWLLGNKTEPARQKTLINNSILKPNKISRDEKYFDNKQRYVGKAAENLVVAELLFRGFNAQILQVDEGIDVFATNIRKNELYLIQVKHTYFDSNAKSRPVSITVSSFEKNKKSNVFYILVLERNIDKRDFLILPFIKVDELIENGSINKNEDSSKMLIKVIRDAEDKVSISNTNVSRYLNAWDILL